MSSIHSRAAPLVRIASAAWLGALCLLGTRCWQNGGCNVEEPCPCIDGTCFLSGAGCNIPGSQTCAELCSAHGGVGGPDASTAVCNGEACVPEEVVPSPFQGFFHMADAGQQHVVNLKLFDAGIEVESFTNCSGTELLVAGWCSEDGGRELIDDSLFVVMGDGGLLEEDGTQWLSGASCLTCDGGVLLTFDCESPVGWDAG
jgi:hypothetical protein